MKADGILRPTSSPHRAPGCAGSTATRARSSPLADPAAGRTAGVVHRDGKLAFCRSARRRSPPLTWTWTRSSNSPRQASPRRLRRTPSLSASPRAVPRPRRSRPSQRHRGTSLTVAVTNDPEGPLAAVADVTLPLLAGIEERRRRVPDLPGDARRPPAACRGGHRREAPQPPSSRWPSRPPKHFAPPRRMAAPSSPMIVEAAQTTYLIAPAERLSSALQSALMLREGPRLPAAATETGDWLHVDVYLSKRPGYTALLFPGSRYDDGRDGVCAGNVRRRSSRSGVRSTEPRSRFRSPVPAIPWSRSSSRPGLRSSSQPSSGNAGSQPAILHSCLRDSPLTPSADWRTLALQMSSVPVQTT